jgi:uncharacterized membrane protein YhaH (DUF805 family)
MRPPRLPPRRSLPRDVVVPSLPGLGFTWYDRRGSYWARRAGLSLMWAIVTTLITLLTVGFLAAIRDSSPAGFGVLLGIEVAYSLGVLAFFAIQTARRWNDPGAPGQLLGRSAAGKQHAGRKSGAARVWSGLGQLLLAFSFPTIGLYLAMLLTSLLPETLAERHARRRIAAELRRRGHVLPEP